MLPDDVLLEIFDIYVDKDSNAYLDYLLFEEQLITEWITLAHVCRRWRSVVFQSPRRLNLQVLCTHKTPAADITDIWPPLPLFIYYSNQNYTSGVDNIIAALGHNDRVSQIQLISLPSSQFEYVTNSAAMQKPFPELTHLGLGRFEPDEPKLPDSFLGGSAPCLRFLELCGVSFPGLLKLLLSATHLVCLHFYNIPHSGYIPPETMVTCLSALTSLKSLYLHFLYRRPRPVLQSRRPHPPPVTRSILPNLTKFEFKGVSEYLEEILARIDSPRLNGLNITFFNQIIFDTPQLFQFVSQIPTLGALEKGYISFDSDAAFVGFTTQTSTSDQYELSMRIQCTTSEWQLSSLEQVCISSLPLVSTLEDLYIEDSFLRLRWQDDVENTQYLELLHPFAAVKNLYLSKEFVPRVAAALQELVGGRTTEVLPALGNMFFEEFQPSVPLHEGIEKFVASRRLTGHPVAVSRWDRFNRFGIGEALGDL